MEMNKWWVHQYYNDNGSAELKLNQSKPSKKNYWENDNWCMERHSFFTYHGNGFKTLEEALEYQERIINGKYTKAKWAVQEQELNGEIITHIMNKRRFLSGLTDFIYNTDLLYDKYEQGAEDTEDFNDFGDYSIYYLQYVIKEIEAGYTVELGNMAFFKGEDMEEQS